MQQGFFGTSITLTAISHVERATGIGKRTRCEKERWTDEGRQLAMQWCVSADGCPAEVGRLLQSLAPAQHVLVCTGLHVTGACVQAAHKDKNCSLPGLRHVDEKRLPPRAVFSQNSLSVACFWRLGFQGSWRLRSDILPDAERFSRRPSQATRSHESYW